MGSLKAVEILIEEARQALQSELNLAMQSLKEEILNQLAGLPLQGAASWRFTSKLDSRHQVSAGSPNSISTFSPHEARPNCEPFPQDLRREVTDSLSLPRAKLGTRSPANAFAPGRHYI